MKIIFDDGSFLEISRVEKDICLSMCGKRDNKLTMTSTILDQTQVEKLAEYLKKCLSDDTQTK